jgi:hypothetical protein
MKIQDFLSSSELQLVRVNGEIVEGVMCRLLSLDEVSALIGDGVKSPIKFGAALLAAALVDGDGKPIMDAASWLRIPFKEQKRFEALVTAVSQINGLMQAEQVEALGKSSGTTGASDSSSNSA